MPHMMTRFRTSTDSRAHVIVSHDALGGLADVHRAMMVATPARKRTAVRRPLRNQGKASISGARAFVDHDALGGLADVHRINLYNSSVRSV